MQHMAIEFAASMGDTHSWPAAIAITVAAGFLAGCFYKFFALMALSFAAVIAAILISIEQEWGLLRATLTIFGMLTVLQAGYLLGAWAAVFAGNPAATAGKQAWASLFAKPARLVKAKWRGRQGGAPEE